MSGYAASAYRFSPEYTQLPAGYKPEFGAIPLARGEYKQQIPQGEREYLKVQVAQDVSVYVKDNQLTREAEYLDAPVRADHQLFRAMTMGGGAGLYFLWMLLTGIGKVMTFVFPVIGLIAALVVWAKTDFEYFMEAITLYGYITLAAIGLWGGGMLFARVFSKALFGDMRPVYELNRQTGNIDIYHKRKTEIIASYPFKDFIAEAMPLVNHQGLASEYALNLRHKSEPKVVIDTQALHPRCTHLSEVKALWDFLQCYMDVSQPLPDCPAFEPFRALDPTTAAFDKTNPRDSHHWRNMDEKVFENQAIDMGIAIRQAYAA